MAYLPRAHRRSGAAYQSRWRPNARTERRYRLPLIGGLALAALIALTWGWRISAVEVTGATIVPNAALRDSVLADIQGRRWGFIPRTSVLFAAPNRLERMLRDRFALESVTVRRHRNGTLTVNVREHAIAAVWTAPEQPPRLLSQGGFVLGTASDALLQEFGVSGGTGGGTPTVPVITLTDVPASSVGDRVLGDTIVALIAATWQELQRAESEALRPRTAVPRPQSTTVDITTAGGARVSLTADASPESQLRKLRSVLQEMSDAQEKSVKSIDLRYGDRVYVQ